VTGYISPIPTIVALDYTSRVAGRPQERRMHVFTGPDGREVRCNPAACRECHREATWTAGQNRGVSAALWVIRRHGAFFRPDAAGYTHHIAAAGFYTETEARKYLDAEGVSIRPLSHYRTEIDAALAGADRLRAALEGEAC